MNRWVAYQEERFPLAGHGPLVAAFSASAVCFSSAVRGHIARPSSRALLVAFLTSLLFFLQLRIADEFKDLEDDTRFRPYRPVPRGLVTLRELGYVGLAAAAAQLALALWLHPPLAWLLLPAWAYLTLMTREFFVARWLKAHPVVYMTSHMMILPLVDFYATACDWRVAGLHRPPDGLLWFLAVSYLNGLVIEIGRKTRAPLDEEEGVETYSALWGVQGAVRAWLGAVAVTAIAAWQASVRIGTEKPTVVFLAVLVGACVVAAVRFALLTLEAAPVPANRVGVRSRMAGLCASVLFCGSARANGKSIELMSGVWTMLMYLGLGAAPLAIQLWRNGR
jgi:4-hydroxybenzoate polyprenyltransferase